MLNNTPFYNFGKKITTTTKQFWGKYFYPGWAAMTKVTSVHFNLKGFFHCFRWFASLYIKHPGNLSTPMRQSDVGVQNFLTSSRSTPQIKPENLNQPRCACVYSYFLCRCDNVIRPNSSPGFCEIKKANKSNRVTTPLRWLLSFKNWWKTKNMMFGCCGDETRREFWEKSHSLWFPRLGWTLEPRSESGPESGRSVPRRRLRGWVGGAKRWYNGIEEAKYIQEAPGTTSCWATPRSFTAKTFNPFNIITKFTQRRVALQKIEQWDEKVTSKSVEGEKSVVRT